MSYGRFAAMIATSIAAMYGLMYLNTYALEHVSWSETRAWMAIVMGATMVVQRDGKPVATMYPERRQYLVQEQVMTEAAIDPGLTRDLYVSLGDPLPGGAWLVKVQHKPFIDWIWAGCLLMALGGFLAASDRRYRFAIREKKLAAEAASA